MVQPICIIFLIALILSLVLASRLSKKIVQPLNELNLDEPMKNEGYDELRPLLRRIESQQRQIRIQSHELEQKKKEFETVTNGMTEGIILLNSKRTILSINPAAQRLFGADHSCIGKYILSVNRSLELQSLLLKAGDGQYAEMIMELGGSKYQLDASPVISDGQVSGTVLLMLDVTEKEKSEQMRREFTANVSHELKTPLHTISGCAELLSNGMVKQEDIPEFSTKIYTEAQRMIRLVEDIIRLSHLDEGATDLKREAVDLYALAENTLQILSQEAHEAKIQMNLEGEKAVIDGIPQLLQGIIYNLCDNAIKYNREGGSVTVSVKNEEHQVQLSVVDTGIGIPEEHQERIFERFYRVDKSHSKEIGGTGLGLSIVKHAARLHDASINVHSVVNGGTTIEVSFPKK
jgi:two-component system phosphate regulon sensor histidine kinase PhoR